MVARRNRSARQRQPAASRDAHAARTHVAVTAPSSAKLHEVLAAADMDLARMTYSNQQELRAYCSRSGGAIQELIGGAARRARRRWMKLDARDRQRTRRRHSTERRSCATCARTRTTAVSICRWICSTEHCADARSTCAHREVAPRLKAALREFRDARARRAASGARCRRARQLRPLAVLAALHRRLLDRIASQ